jgi:hypothetical protein
MTAGDLIGDDPERDRAPVCRTLVSGDIRLDRIDSAIADCPLSDLLVKESPDWSLLLSLVLDSSSASIEPALDPLLIGSPFDFLLRPT